MPERHSDSLSTGRMRWLSSGWTWRILFAIVVSILLVLMLFGTGAH